MEVAWQDVRTRPRPAQQALWLELVPVLGFRVSVARPSAASATHRPVSCRTRSGLVRSGLCPSRVVLLLLFVSGLLLVSQSPGRRGGDAVTSRTPRGNESE